MLRADFFKADCYKLQCCFFDGNIEQSTYAYFSLDFYACFLNEETACPLYIALDLVE